MMNVALRSGVGEVLAVGRCDMVGFCLAFTSLRPLQSTYFQYQSYEILVPWTAPHQNGRQGSERHLYQTDCGSCPIGSYM